VGLLGAYIASVFEGKFKLNQNRSEVDRRSVVTALKQFDSNTEEAGVCHLMQQFDSGCPFRVTLVQGREL